MEMNIIEIRELKASEGMVLTNGEAFSDVGGSVYLGKNDSAENWHEITDAEAERIQAEMMPNVAEE